MTRRNICITVLVCSFFVVPRMWNTFKEMNTVDILKTEIILIDDKSRDVEVFAQQILQLLNDGRLEKFKLETREYIEYIAFCKVVESNMDTTNMTLADYYTQAFMVLYEVARDNDNKLTLGQIFKISEQLKEEKPESWKAFVDSKRK